MKRFGIVNVTKGQYFHRPTMEVAVEALKGLQAAGEVGFIVDGQAAQVVAASQLPFHVDVERGVLYLMPSLGIDMETARALESAVVPALVVMDRDASGVLKVRGATEYEGVDVDGSGAMLVVDGVQIERESIARLAQAAGKPLRSYVEDGVVKVLVMPEPAPAPAPAHLPGDARGGIAVPEKGDPEALRVMPAAELIGDTEMPSDALIGSSKLDAVFPEVVVDMQAGGPLSGLVRLSVPEGFAYAVRPLQLGDVVAEAHRASGLTVEVWNGLDEEAREQAIAAALSALRECAAGNSAAGTQDTVAGADQSAAGDAPAASEAPAKPASAPEAGAPQEG